MGDAGVIDQNVNRPYVLRDRCNALLARIEVGYVPSPDGISVSLWNASASASFPK